MATLQKASSARFTLHGPQINHMFANHLKQNDAKTTHHASESFRERIQQQTMPGLRQSAAHHFIDASHGLKSHSSELELCRIMHLRIQFRIIGNTCEAKSACHCTLIRLFIRLHTCMLPCIHQAAPAFPQQQYIKPHVPFNSLEAPRLRPWS